jgi:hypothetical protein
MGLKSLNEVGRDLNTNSRLECIDKEENLKYTTVSEKIDHIIFAKMNSDIKNINISPDSKYLICSSVQEEKTYPAVMHGKLKRLSNPNLNLHMKLMPKNLRPIHTT